MSKEEKAVKSFTVTVRLTSQTRAVLDRLAARHPYPIPVTVVVERGIELVAAEVARMDAALEAKEGGDGN